MKTEKPQDSCLRQKGVPSCTQGLTRELGTLGLPGLGPSSSWEKENEDPSQSEHGNTRLPGLKGKTAD